MSKLKRTKEDCHIEALKYTSRNSFKKGTYAIYYYALKYGWLDDICNHMECLNKTRTKEDCHIEALKYTQRNEFYTKSSTIYYYSRLHNWLDDICGHMKSKLYERTKEDCHKEALKYTSRSEFIHNDGNAYKKAQIKGWLDDICGHMISKLPKLNILYLWKASNNQLWKVGISNINNYTNRIQHVASAHGFDIEYSFFIVTELCRQLETEILTMGINPVLEKKEGYTEFRIFTDHDLDIIFRKMKMTGETIHEIL